MEAGKQLRQNITKALENFNKAIAPVCVSTQAEKDMATMEAISDGTGLVGLPYKLKEWSDTMLAKLKESDLTKKETCAIKLMTGAILKASNSRTTRDPLNGNQSRITRATTELDRYCKVALAIEGKMSEKQVIAGKQVIKAAGIDIWPAVTNLLQEPNLKQETKPKEEIATIDEMRDFWAGVRQKIEDGSMGSNRKQVSIQLELGLEI